MKPILGLLVVKSLVTPMLTHLAVAQTSYLLQGQSDPALSNFAFLYGSIPPALGRKTTLLPEKRILFKIKEQGRIWEGSKAPQEPLGFTGGTREPPVDLVGKNFPNACFV